MKITASTGFAFNGIFRHVNHEYHEIKPQHAEEINYYVYYPFRDESDQAIKRVLTQTNTCKIKRDNINEITTTELGTRLDITADDWYKLSAKAQINYLNELFNFS